MSKLIFFLLTFIFFSVDNKIKAQHNSFKKIEYASFDINSPRTKEKDSANIDLYSIIDANGFVTILNDDNYHNTLTFYTYKLSISQLKRINSIFNNKKNLKDYIVKKKLNDSVLFAGSYNFFLVTYLNDYKDSLCFIDPFMSQDFKYVLHILEDIYYVKKNTKRRSLFTIPQYFKKALISSYKESNYLPKIKFPPPFQ